MQLQHQDEISASSFIQSELQLHSRDHVTPNVSTSMLKGQRSQNRDLSAHRQTTGAMTNRRQNVLIKAVVELLQVNQNTLQIWTKKPNQNHRISGLLPQIHFTVWILGLIRKQSL